MSTIMRCEVEGLFSVDASDLRNGIYTYRVPPKKSWLGDITSLNLDNEKQNLSCSLRTSICLA